VVRRTASDAVLPAAQGDTGGRSAIRRTHQGDDRGEPVVRLSHRGSPARLQQERGAAHFPAQRLAGEEAPNRLPPSRASPAVGSTCPERWETDLCQIWAGRDQWTTLALVIDCHTRELLGWHLSRSGKAKTAEAALEQALIARYGKLGRVATPFLLRSDNGLVFTSRSYTALVRSYGLRQEFITPHTPEQNGMVERVIWTLKEQCAHRHRFETLQHASRVIGDWISFYNNRRPHQALGMKTPAATFALAAWPEQKRLGHYRQLNERV
jgi:transposase InsO family protein